MEQLHSPWTLGKSESQRPAWCQRAWRRHRKRDCRSSNKRLWPNFSPDLLPRPVPPFDIIHLKRLTVCNLTASSWIHWKKIGKNGKFSYNDKWNEKKKLHAEFLIYCFSKSICLIYFFCAVFLKKDVSFYFFLSFVFTFFGEGGRDKNISNIYI